tara:strand:- start:655 stop:1176 length:522 start_codon:yes stop_codon:yes gene_type:complete
MLEMINNFAGFNLAAILFALIGGGIFMIIFHYLIMPILTLVLIKPLATVIETTVNFFSNTVTSDNQRDSTAHKKEFSENLVNWFSNYFILKVFIFLYLPFFILIYIFESFEKDYKLSQFNETFFVDIFIGSLIFLSIVLTVSIVAKLGKMGFKSTFVLSFIFLFFLGFIQYFI